MTNVVKFIHRNGMKVAVEGRSTERRGDFRVVHSAMNPYAKILINRKGPVALREGGGVGAAKVMGRIMDGGLCQLGLRKPSGASVIGSRKFETLVEKMEGVKKEGVKPKEVHNILNLGDVGVKEDTSPAKEVEAEKIPEVNEEVKEAVERIVDAGEEKPKKRQRKGRRSRKAIEADLIDMSETTKETSSSEE